MTTITPGTGVYFERFSQDLSALRTRTERLQQQIASGTRLTRSSDDPAAASRLRQLAQQDGLSKVAAATADRAAADLSLTDDALSSFTDAIGEAKALAVQAANGTLSIAQRANIGTALLQLRDGMFALANSWDDAGGALFAGQAPGPAYGLNSGGNAVYLGTASSGTLTLGAGQSVTRGLTGPEFLNFTISGTPTDLLAEVAALGTALQAGASNGASLANGALATFDTALDTVSTQQTIVGTRLAWIDVTTDRRAVLSDQRAATAVAVGGIDLASTIADLQHAMLVLDASQASFARVSGLSLFDHLR